MRFLVFFSSFLKVIEKLINAFQGKEKCTSGGGLKKKNTSIPLGRFVVLLAGEQRISQENSGQVHLFRGMRGKKHHISHGFYSLAYLECICNI